MAKIAAIVAVCDDWGIGLDGHMVVENRVDMRHFVRQTTGHTVIMGRKTLLSFPGGRPLKDRRNIVLTRDTSFTCDGAEVAHSVDEALALLGGDELAWVVGGAEIYDQLLPACERAVVTRNHCVRPVDTFFPNLDADPAWKLVEVEDLGVIEAGSDAGVSFDIAAYRRTCADHLFGPVSASTEKV